MDGKPDSHAAQELTVKIQTPLGSSPSVSLSFFFFFFTLLLFLLPPPPPPLLPPLSGLLRGTRIVRGPLSFGRCWKG